MTQLAMDFTAPRPDEPLAALALVQAEPRRYRHDFAKWLLDNWPIWRAFDREASRLWDMGRRHYGARTIWEVLRHNTVLAEREGEFKLNDHWPPYLARLWIAFHPEREGFFEFREQRKAA